ncbi:hypothetical protein Tco_0510746 [Tanacetum coccineum]
MSSTSLHRKFHALSFTSLDEFVNKPVVENSNMVEEELCISLRLKENRLRQHRPKQSPDPKGNPKLIAITIQRMVKPVWNNAQRVNHQNFAKKTHPCTKKNLVPRAVLMKSGLVSVNTARQVNVAYSKTTVNVARPMSYLSKSAYSTDHRVIDSGCSRHMTRNMSYLTDYEEIDGGYVAFGGNPKGGKITRKCTIKTGAQSMVLLVLMMTGSKPLSDDGEKKVDEIQEKKVNEELKRFTEVKTASTPMETQKPLLKDEDGKEVDVHMYRSMIGSLMYLTSSRPDIMFAVCACARYQVNPKVSHLHVVKRIFSDLLEQAWILGRSITEVVNSLDATINIIAVPKKTVVLQISITKAEYVAALSCCGQFWSTVVAKTINGEEQLHALVDGKKIIITESSIRRDLQLADEEDKTVHKELGDSLVRAATTTSSLEVE